MLGKGFIPPAPFKGGEGYALDTARTCHSKRLKPINRRSLPRSPPNADRSALFLVLFFGEQKKNKPRGRGAKRKLDCIKQWFRKKHYKISFKGGEGYALDTARTCHSKRLKPIKRRRLPRSPPKADRSALFLVLFLGEQKKNKPRGRGAKQHAMNGKPR
jgi:hypothetical protein